MGKEWYKSKGILAGIALIVKAVFYDFYYSQDLNTATTSLFIGLGLIGIRQAIN